MRALVQRVTEASVAVEGEVVGSIGWGLVVLLGVGEGDEEADARYIVNKIANLRIFSGPEGRFDVSGLDAGAELLLVSQFTLYADTRKGRRPAFVNAAPPQAAEHICRRVGELFKESGLKVETGRFQQQMKVTLVNDGPVTILVDSSDRHRPRKG